MTLIDKAEALAALRKHAKGETILGGQVYQSLTLETALEAIAALPARGVGVKPLVWQFEQEDVQVANTSARHQYRVIYDRRATKGAWSWFCDGAWIGCETEEAAKAAAQADYEARILAALAPAEAGGVEADDRIAALWAICGAATVEDARVIAKRTLEANNQYPPAPAPVDALVKAVEAEIDARQAYEAATSGDFPRTKEREWMNARAKVIAALAAYRGGAK